MENILKSNKIRNVSFEFRPLGTYPIHVKSAENGSSWTIKTENEGSTVTLQDLADLYIVLQQIETINNK